MNTCNLISRGRRSPKSAASTPSKNRHNNTLQDGGSFLDTSQNCPSVKPEDAAELPGINERLGMFWSTRIISVDTCVYTSEFQTKRTLSSDFKTTLFFSVLFKNPWECNSRWKLAVVYGCGLTRGDPLSFFILRQMKFQLSNMNVVKTHLCEIFCSCSFLFVCSFCIIGHLWLSIFMAQFEMCMLSTTQVWFILRYTWF